MHLRFWSWKYWFGGCSICSDNLWQSVMLVVTSCGFGGDNFWSWWWQFLVLVVTICGLGGDDQLQFVLVSHSAQVRGKPNGVLLVAHHGRHEPVVVHLSNVLPRYRNGKRHSLPSTVLHVFTELPESLVWSYAGQHELSVDPTDWQWWKVLVGSHLALMSSNCV